MTDENQEQPADEDRDDERVESAELDEQELDGAAGGNMTIKNPNSPFD